MICLRKYKPEDIERLSALADNKNVSRYLTPRFPFPYTLEDAKWWVEKGADENGQINRVIEYQGKLAGGIGFIPQKEWKAHKVELGYWLGVEYWGKGIVTEAIQQMENHVLPPGKFEKIFAPVLGPNKASMRVLEKNNYQLEGILKNEVRKDNMFYDIHLFAKFI